MERIKQALDKAKAERGDDNALQSPRVEPQQAPGHAPLREGSGITYSRTNVSQADPVAMTNHLVLDGHQHDAATAAYKILRTQVDQRMAARGWNTLAVTSPGPGAGKTTTAVNLSMALARELHRTVLLVDLDLRDPSVHKAFGLEPRHGLVDFLLDDVQIGDILIHPGIERLVVLPAGKTVGNSSELLSSPRMIELADQLKKRYESRIVVFDMPALLSTDDTLAFAPYVDCVLLVVDDNHTTKDELLAAGELLANVNVLGSVLNRASEQQSVDV